MSILEDLTAEVRAHEATTAGDLTASWYVPLIKKALVPAIGSGSRLVAALPVDVSVDSENRPARYPDRTIETPRGLAAFLGDRVVVSWAEGEVRQTFTTHTFRYADLKSAETNDEAIGVDVRERISWTLLFTGIEDTDTADEFRAQALDLLTTALEDGRLTPDGHEKTEKTITKKPTSQARKAASRRNLILAAATVAVMAVVAAGLYFLTGEDGIPGVEVDASGDIPVFTVDTTPEVQAGSPKIEVVSEGDGAKVGDGDYFGANYAFVNAETGEILESSFGDTTTGAPAQRVAFQNIKGEDATSRSAPGLPEPVIEAIAGTTVGSKILIAMTGVDFFGQDLYDQAEAAGALDQVPYAADETLLFYLDISGAVDEATDPVPSGTEQQLPAGVPTPVADGDSLTGLNVGGATTADAEGAYPAVVGDGAKVEAGDILLTNYVGQTYAGTVFDTSFGPDGGPRVLTLGGTIACWQDGLVGQTVGSRVVLTCPADVAYGDTGDQSGQIAPGEAITFVVDIVGAF